MTLQAAPVVGGATYGGRVSHQFSEHDPSGQSIRAAEGLTTYDSSGWRRWLVPLGVIAVVVAALSIVVVAVTR